MHIHTHIDIYIYTKDWKVTESSQADRLTKTILKRRHTYLSNLRILFENGLSYSCLFQVHVFSNDTHQTINL